ncbi:MAG: HEAT repeat domain-containing protein [Planctomycetota bacterium]
MLALLLYAPLFFCPQAGEEKPAPPPVEEVARVRGELEAALRSHEQKALEQALAAAQQVPHAEVVKQVLRALEDERPPVRLAALQALRWIRIPESLAALHGLARDKKLMRESELGAAVLRAIGQHADSSSVAILAREPFEPQRGDCIKARIYTLGRIRTRAALETLFAMVSTVPQGNHPRPIVAHMKETRLVLALLTGVDQGDSPEAWEAWWRAHKKGFELSAEPPELPREWQETWADYWGLARDYGRGGRREDRGKD